MINSNVIMFLLQEKALGVTPSEMMDRERAFIPELQLGFVDGIAGPLYKSVPPLMNSWTV